MTRDQALAFAKEWAAAWNRRDIDAVISHFHDDVEFTSAKAQQFMGRATVRGKKELLNYWQTALRHVQELHFEIDDVVWDAEAHHLAIMYRARLNGKTSRALELLTLDGKGMAIRGVAYYGAEVTP